MTIRLTTGRRRSPRGARAATVAVLAASALALASCGGSTVESADVTDTTTSGGGQSSSGASSTPGEEASESSSAQTSRRQSAERDITEPGASRASAAPDGRMPLTADDEKFLDALSDARIKVDGTEDQLIAAGHVHCDAKGGDGADTVLVDAVAGQLIEQGRTEADAAAVAKSIANAAETAYC